MNLGSNKGDRNDDSSPKITGLQSSLLMIIVDNLEKDVSQSKGNTLTRKLRKDYVKSSSSLFSCSIHDIYTRVNCDQKKCLMLKPYITRVYPWIGAKRCYNKYFLNISNELHD